MFYEDYMVKKNNNFFSTFRSQDIKLKEMVPEEFLVQATFQYMLC